MGIETDISNTPDLTADINHHLIYNSFNGVKTTIDSLMITHIDSIFKLNLVRRNMETALAGICMSRETMEYLVKMGIDKKRICYVNPAHDENMPIQKITIGIASRVYPDGRKNEFYFDRLAKKLNPAYFKIRIMGDGWEPQVEKLRQNKFEVDFLDHFDYEEYLRFIPSLDYYLYTGFDEGQMGFVDALSAGVKTIVTPHGYHLDAENGITHPFTSYEELEAILLDIQNKKHNLIRSVSSWGWYNYTMKHVEIWEYLLGNKKKSSTYVDGLNSLIADSSISPLDKEEIVQNEKKLVDREKFYLKKTKKKQIKKILSEMNFIEIVVFFFTKARKKMFKK
jgi:hypothetical protein